MPVGVRELAKGGAGLLFTALTDVEDDGGEAELGLWNDSEREGGCLDGPAPARRNNCNFGSWRLAVQRFSHVMAVTWELKGGYVGHAWRDQI